MLFGKKKSLTPKHKAKWKHAIRIAHRRLAVGRQPPIGPSHNKRCVKSHFFLEHFKSVPDGQRLNIVVADTGSIGTESVGPFLRLNSAMAHVDVGPPVPACTPESSAIWKSGFRSANPARDGPRALPGLGLGRFGPRKGERHFPGSKSRFHATRMRETR